MMEKIIKFLRENKYWIKISGIQSDTGLKSTVQKAVDGSQKINPRHKWVLYKWILNIQFKINSLILELTETERKNIDKLTIQVYCKKCLQKTEQIYFNKNRHGESIYCCLKCHTYNFRSDNLESF